MQPFLKWAGGKRWLVEKHPEWFLVKCGKHVEPFLGSGTVFFHASPRSAILSDLNDLLIDTYVAVRDSPDVVYRNLKKHHRLHSREYYYKIRSITPRTKASRAARFIYLNRTCFNAIYRVNANGQFNVPIGTKNDVVRPGESFLDISNLLLGKDIVSGDFSEAIMKCADGDLLYLDPPYTVKHNNNNFIKYNEKIFSWGDQKRLAQCALIAAKRGVQVLVSNAMHKCIEELYSDSLWVRIPVSRWSTIGSRNSSRKITEEYVISNYIDETGELSSLRF